MPRTLKSLLMLAALLAGATSALTGCVVLPYDDGYGYRGGYWDYEHHRDHDDWGHRDRDDRRR